MIIMQEAIYNFFIFPSYILKKDALKRTGHSFQGVFSRNAQKSAANAALFSYSTRIRII